jgi:hypothetical protein
MPNTGITVNKGTSAQRPQFAVVIRASPAILFIYSLLAQNLSAVRYFAAVTAAWYTRSGTFVIVPRTSRVATI